VARKIGPAAAIAPLRFSPHQAMLDVQAAHARALSRALADMSSDENWNKRSAAQRFFLTVLVHPYLRLCATETIRSNLRNAIFIRDYPRCRFEPAKVEQPRTFLPWNPIDVWVLPARGTTRANRLLLDFEGTEKIASWRGEREMPSHCPGGKWLFENGVLRFTLPVPEKEGGLPTRHELTAEPNRLSSGTSSATALRDRARG
jgi:hypothetical protein